MPQVLEGRSDRPGFAAMLRRRQRPRRWQQQQQQQEERPSARENGTPAISSITTFSETSPSKFRRPCHLSLNDADDDVWTLGKTSSTTQKGDSPNSPVFAQPVPEDPPYSSIEADLQHLEEGPILIQQIPNSNDLIGPQDKEKEIKNQVCRGHSIEEYARSALSTNHLAVVSPNEHFPEPTSTPRGLADSGSLPPVHHETDRTSASRREKAHDDVGEGAPAVPATAVVRRSSGKRGRCRPWMTYLGNPLRAPSLCQPPPRKRPHTARPGRLITDSPGAPRDHEDEEDTED